MRSSMLSRWALRLFPGVIVLVVLLVGQAIKSGQVAQGAAPGGATSSSSIPPGSGLSGLLGIDPSAALGRKGIGPPPFPYPGGRPEDPPGRPWSSPFRPW